MIIFRISFFNIARPCVSYNVELYRAGWASVKPVHKVRGQGTKQAPSVFVQSMEMRCPVNITNYIFKKS